MLKQQRKKMKKLKKRLKKKKRKEKSSASFVQHGPSIQVESSSDTDSDGGSNRQYSYDKGTVKLYSVEYYGWLELI